MRELIYRPEDACAQAREFFMQGYNCAQSVAGVFHRELGLSR